MTDFQTIYQEAHEAGMKAGDNSIPIPMIVGQETSLFSNKIDYTKPTYVVNDGACGFAWVNIKPGNCAFANWLKKNDLASTDSYYGGVSLWVSEFNQSVTRKAAYAAAFVEVVRKYNVAKKIYSASRLD